MPMPPEYQLIKEDHFTQVWELPKIPPTYVVQLHCGRVLEATHDPEEAYEIADNFERSMVG